MESVSWIWQNKGMNTNADETREDYGLTVWTKEIQNFQFTVTVLL